MQTRILPMCLMVLLSGCPEKASNSTAALTEVDPSTVCMVTNKSMHAKQLAVPFEGRQYFGCCQMCVGKLQSNASVRTAVDPQTAETVDKASAVIGERPDGTVEYFANKTNFGAYLSKHTD